MKAITCYVAKVRLGVDFVQGDTDVCTYLSYCDERYVCRALTRHVDTAAVRGARKSEML